VLAVEPGIIMMQSGISLLMFQGGGAASPGLGYMLGPMIFIFAIFYFLLIMPQQRKQKRWQAMINDLKTGDRVVTGGGIRGIIISVKDDAVQLRVAPDNLRLEVAKSSVISLARDEEPAPKS
jgi:preprotein translocase subunit YajC